MVSKKLLYTTSNKTKDPNDEFYTTKEDAEKILGQFNFKDLKVYCCCDSEKSELVKYLKGKCKELIYTSDDYANHEDLFKWADVIVTNPPFSKWAERFRFFTSFNKKFLLCGSFLSGFNKELLERYKKDTWICGLSKKFITPDGSKKEVKALWYTDLPKPQ